jgi:signal transduction histidine kinase
VFWIAHRALYLVLVYRSAAQSEIETELSKQIRARLMAEAEVTRKSKELAETNAELARANSDLEAYASIIAHDLKSPLRAMRYLTEDIEAALESGNNAGAKSKFDALKLQSRRMSSMMAALFDYSSIGRKQDTIEGVDTGALVGDICGSLHVPAGMKILISGEWPAVRTSKAPLDLVLRNLVDNAIKHHDRSSGTVEVHASNEGQSLAISIKDDGPGIPPHLHDAVFLPFRKGVKSDQIGHGMGLALVKKTVELQGGRIEVHSDPEKRVGTEFRVVWPIAPASASDRNENS